MSYKGSLFQVLDRYGGFVGNLVFDAIVSEGHKVENVVTEFPVDAQFVVSDHAIRKCRLLKMEIMSTRHSFREQTGMTAKSPDKVRADFDLLTSMIQQGLRCNVTTILGIYTNCAVTSLETFQDVDTATVMKARITLKEMIVVDSDPSPSKQSLVDSQIDGSNNDASLQSLIGEEYILEGEASGIA